MQNLRGRSDDKGTTIHNPWNCGNHDSDSFDLKRIWPMVRPTSKVTAKGSYHAAVEDLLSAQRIPATIIVPVDYGHSRHLGHSVRFSVVSSIATIVWLFGRIWRTSFILDDWH